MIKILAVIGGRFFRIHNWTRWNFRSTYRSKILKPQRRSFSRPSHLALQPSRLFSNPDGTGPPATRTRVSANRPGSTRYKGRVTRYLYVITAQRAALADEVTAVNILGRRMADTVLLMQALGGGWDRSTLPPRPECCGKQQLRQLIREPTLLLNLRTGGFKQLRETVYIGRACVADYKIA
jgi:hypothetical protein